MKLKFVTGNRHKFKEAQEIAGEHGLEIEHEDVPYAEIQSSDLSNIAKSGVKQASSIINKPCFVEDAGLFVESLNGFPGPYSSYVFETLGNEGILRLIGDEKDRSAEFRSVVAYCEPHSEPKLFFGKAEGTIAESCRGSGGFGYDPIFVPDMGDGSTFAQLTTEEKDSLSHRGSAIEKFVKWWVRNRRAGSD